MGEMFADSFTKPLQGATFQRFQGMIKVISNSTPDAEMSCLRAMAKITGHECVGKNNRQTHGTATVSTDYFRGTCTDARRSTCTDKHTHVSTNNDA